jgi:hypothetical protein
MQLWLQAEKSWKHLVRDDCEDEDRSTLIQQVRLIRRRGASGSQQWAPTTRAETEDRLRGR